jgi:imidazolonepropionase-like amidohydrolase
MGSINSLEQINKWRNSVANGQLVGPRIIVGQQVDGVGGLNVSFVYRVRGVAEARTAVQRIKSEGFDFVKVYGRLSRDEYLAVVDEAKRINIPVAGHVSLGVSAGEASDAGLKSIEHLEGMLVSVSSEETRIRKGWIEHEAKLASLKGKPAPPELEAEEFRFLTEAMDTFDAEKAKRIYQQLARNETYHCPTLVIHRAWGSLSNPAFFNDALLRYVPKRQRQSINTYVQAARSWSSEKKAIARRLFEYRLRMVGDLNRNGVKLLAGTDTAYGYPVGGFALHDELALFVEAGLSPMEALQTATINPAKFFHRETELGTVEKGKLADLVLLDANPLTDIANTRKINAVVLNGRLLDRQALIKTLSAIEAAANKK